MIGSVRNILTHRIGISSSSSSRSGATRVWRSSRAVVDVGPIIRRRCLCLCGVAFKNYSEQQLRFKGVHLTIHTPYRSVIAFEQDLKDILKRWEFEDGRRSAFL